MFRRWWSVAATVAAVVGVLAAAALLRGSPQDEAVAPADRVASSMSAQEWAAEPDLPGAEVRAEAVRVVESFTGSVEEKDALSLIEAYAGNAALDACMAEKGIPEWDWSLSRSYAIRGDPLTSQLWLQEPLRRWESENLLANQPFLQAEVVMNNPDPATDEASSACLAELGPEVGSKEAELATPRVIDRLTRQWYAMVAKSGQALGLPAADGYWACMDAADIAVLDDQDLPASEIGPALTGWRPDRDEIPTSVEDAERWASAGWQRLLAGEDEFFRADWECRRDVYSAHIEQMLPRIRQFEQEHAVEIAEARNAWTDVMAEAARLGYDGQRGPLGG
ncbi:MAG: hypothetical protein R2731_17695 [Nocardioides sp.]